ncbi:MAG: Nif3-like dinuclear metal center hexameric protein [Chthoniobacteraceae bacterium]|nr:Nif3-like dinuclear metal center hexameric protein [Chthoniobacteraceae bacterium]
MPKPRLSSLAAGLTGASLSEVVRHLETTLHHRDAADWSNAMNGLQVENRGRIHRIGAAVDACEATLRMAAERGVDFLLVHHGLFWGGQQAVQGPQYRKLRLALDADLAVFSSHLPLDAHPRLGNNALLAKALGVRRPEPFFFEKGRFIGWKGALSLDLAALAARLETAVGGPVKQIGGGPKRTGVVGVVTGGAGGELVKAAAEGVDTFVTGEGPHWSYTAAEELGLNLLFAGHYATETFGVKALAAHLSRKYRLPWEFLDHPTGL